ncbi:MAG TPA: YebC/PmpR family DNA-binding transcriptional regulator, partial [Pseudolysinimonas sp.]|nr:YebC/PmpR family DNA-binding transcriptional regulator [Pseudolysinimonas sp.]
GVISITKTDGVSEDDILLAVMDAGAEDVADQGGGFEVITDPSQLVAARTALVDAGIDYDSAEAEFVPSLRVEADAETARKVFRLIDALEDSDDVQNIFTNIDVPADVQAVLDNDE